MGRARRSGGSDASFAFDVQFHHIFLDVII